MIDEYYGEFVLICDNCEEAHEDKFTGFFEARRRGKEDGWVTKRIVGEWVNYCPRCQK